MSYHDTLLSFLFFINSAAALFLQFFAKHKTPVLAVYRITPDLTGINSNLFNLDF